MDIAVIISISMKTGEQAADAGRLLPCLVLADIFVGEKI